MRWNLNRLAIGIFAAAASTSLVLVVSAPPAEAEARIQNRLAQEASPYLRQHAENPIDWYPWGDEAFAKARAEDKPILLSVGYSTCHWCHVMAAETYSDEDVAAFLNQNFVAIKVDRERRPDVDETYMLATQYFAEVGGWPNNVFLTPDLKPFYGGVYFPRDAFFNLTQQVMLNWISNRQMIEQEADRMAGLIHQVMTYRAEAREVTPEVLSAVAVQVAGGFDPKHGGLGTAPKFPREKLLMLLLDIAETQNDAQALSLVTDTLDHLLRGGIRDQLGGGVHRYAVDREWLTPHYETMLYTQAHMVRVLLQAYRLTGHERYRDAVRGILAFVQRDLTAPNGAFYSALDAQSRNAEGKLEEGYYYTWTVAELEAALSPEDARFAATVFGFLPEFEVMDRRPLALAAPAGDLAQTVGLSNEAFAARLETVSRALHEARGNRAPPHRDEKLLTGWNGLMITAFAEASVVLDDTRYADVATRAAQFFWNDMRGENGELRRYAFDGKAELIATQADTALLALGYLAIYDATREGVWLERAKTLGETMQSTFFDPETNDYFMTPAGEFYRPKIMIETDLPSGNALAIELFGRLHQRDLDVGHRAIAEKVLSAVSGNLVGAPTENAYGLRVAHQFLEGETGGLQMIAGGRVRAIARAHGGGAVVNPDTTGGSSAADAAPTASASDCHKKATAFSVEIDIAPGWHINAIEPLDENLVGTAISHVAWAEHSTTLELRAPEPLVKTLGFSDTPLAIYEERVRFDVALSGSDGANSAAHERGHRLPRHVALAVQACSDEICLEPEVMHLSVLPAQ